MAQISRLSGRAGQTALEPLPPPARAMTEAHIFIALLARAAKSQRE
jgi:hypothetical protein